MFRSRHRVHPLSRLHRVGDVLAFADDIHAHGPWHRLAFHPTRFRPRPFRLRPHRAPSFARILLAGLAVFAFVKLMSAAGRPRRSTIQKVVLGVLLLGIGAIVMSFRRSARGYRW